MVVILIFLLLPIAVTFFVPFMYVCWFMAFWCGVVAVVYGLGSLYAFDPTDPEEWKLLAGCLLVPGSAALILYLLGKFLGMMTLMDVIHMISG